MTTSVCRVILNPYQGQKPIRTYTEGLLRPCSPDKLFGTSTQFTYISHPKNQRLLNDVGISGMKSGIAFPTRFLISGTFDELMLFMRYFILMKDCS
jgi:hypothetical protein